MKIILTESQIKKLVESKVPLDVLNNLINKNLENYKYNYVNLDEGKSYIEPERIILEGDLTDKDITVRVIVGDIYYRGNNVTEFAKNYALYSDDYDEDTSMAYNFKRFISNTLNKKILKLTSTSINDTDVILDLY